jgi:hypothetical protein
MSKSLNISVLVAARDEYIEQLRCILCPLIIQGINSIYTDSLELSNGKKTLYKFQELLREIPKWNQTILQEESKRIKKKCPYIMDIVTAIFVSSVKILASVRLKGKNDNIRVKIPTSDIFIHSIYIESAQQIFYNPYLFYHKNSFGKVQENKVQVEEIIRYSVDKTIRQMLPLDSILQEYLANALNDNADNDSSDESEELSDSDEESLNGEQIVGEEDFESENENENENVVKNFNVDNHGHIVPPEFGNIPPPENNGNIPPEFQSVQQPQINENNLNNLNTFNEIPRQRSRSGSSSSSSSSSSSESSSSSSSSSSSGSSSRSRNRDRHEKKKDDYSFFD